MLGVDTEVRAARRVAAGWSGTEHLDAFADVVADFASRPAATVAGLLAYLDAAEQVENGLAPAEISVAHDRVQILTVHAAKGLEWQVVAVPHLSGRVFPSTASTRTWLTDAGDLPPLLRGDRATLSEHGVPVLDTSDVNDRKKLSDKISDHKDSLAVRRVDEERRLLYVAITRAEDTLLLSGHHWGASESKPRGPSAFLDELKDIIEQAAAAGEPCGVIEQWAPAPAAGEPNPLRDNVVEAVWPVDPAGSRRDDVGRGAALVSHAMSGGADAPSTTGTRDGHPTSTRFWPNATARPTAPSRRCRRSFRSAHWSNSDATPMRQHSGCDAGCRAGPIHMPYWAPHSTIGCSASITPSGSSISMTCPAPWITTPRSPTISPNCRPRSRFPHGPPAPRSMSRCRSTWSSAAAWCAGASTRSSPTTTAAPPWWTGRQGIRPTHRRPSSTRPFSWRCTGIAWAALQNCAVESVRAAFHYVRSGQTVAPDALLGSDDLLALLTDDAA